MESLTLQPIARVDGTINLPGSKSVSNRALLLAALANGTTVLTNLLDSDDVRHMLNALNALGISYTLSADRTRCEIIGNGGALHAERAVELFLGNAGTAMRPLAAALCLGSNDIVLTGEPRMKERPIGHLVDALRQGGANIEYLEQENYPPLRLRGGFSGGQVEVDGSVSSQFLTALLMTAPLAPQDTTIAIKGELVSKPYIDMTLDILKKFGVRFIIKDNLIVKNFAEFNYLNYEIEIDYSSLAYFACLGSLKGYVNCSNLNLMSYQGDKKIIEILMDMGAKIDFSLDN
uniref:3-phosphoshikimate 1-carboxyvinyltransferase n=1 Tax=uncultured Citrobacter sp. TaxID=200446 RepID=UPI002592E939